jgi:hypothetical protein
LPFFWEGFCSLLPITFGALLGYRSPVLLPLLVAAYWLIGVALGLAWPRVGWRLGLYLFASWPPILLFALFLGGENSRLKATLEGLLEQTTMVIAGCLGVAIGALTKRRLMKRIDLSHRQ